MGTSDLERHSVEDPETRAPGHAASPRQLARIVGVAVAGALTVVTVGLVLALWGLGLTGKISQSTSEVLDLVKLGFALVAGVGGTVGLVLAYQRHLIAVEAGQRESAKEAREEAKEAREEAKLFNERFGAAASQLASEQYAVKLAGVYAMAKLADDWDTGRQTCINVLCANLRRGYTPRPADDAGPEGLLAFSDNQEFRHTIIAVIATRLRDEHSPWHGCDFDFRGTVFDGGDFSGAIFSRGTMDFSGATFNSVGAVDFSLTKFCGATVNFYGAAFAGGSVNFMAAIFASGSVDFNGARFSGADVNFYSATFSGGDVGFARAAFSHGTADFRLMRLSGAAVYFNGATFSGGTVDFGHAMFSGGIMNFREATFSGGTVNFGKAKFSGGTVDFKQVSDFSIPPRFSFEADAAPDRVLLPTGPDTAGAP